MNKPNCCACTHSYGVPSVMSLSLVCRLTGKDAVIPCLKFCYEPGTDVEEYIALQDGHVTGNQGRGD